MCVRVCSCLLRVLGPVLTFLFDGRCFRPSVRGVVPGRHRGRPRSVCWFAARSDPAVCLTSPRCCAVGVRGQTELPEAGGVDRNPGAPPSPRPSVVTSERPADRSESGSVVPFTRSRGVRGRDVNGRLRPLPAPSPEPRAPSPAGRHTKTRLLFFYFTLFFKRLRRVVGPSAPRATRPRSHPQPRVLFVGSHGRHQRTKQSSESTSPVSLRVLGVSEM